MTLPLSAPLLRDLTGALAQIQEDGQVLLEAQRTAGQLREEVDQLRRELHEERRLEQCLSRVKSPGRGEETTMADILVHGHDVNQVDLTEDEDVMEMEQQMMKRIWEEGKTRQALSLEQAHRLTGKSEFLLRNGTMRGVRLETFYQGTYHETYYVILRPPGPRGQAKGIQWRIHRHTLPSFIPLRRLERTWMGKNEKRLWMEVDEHLQAYVSRREQLKALRSPKSSPYWSVQDIQAEASLSFVALTLHPLSPSPSQSVIMVRLMYEDLMASRPTRSIVLTSSSSGKHHRFREVETHFQRDSLPTVVGTLSKSVFSLLS